MEAKKAFIHWSFKLFWPLQLLKSFWQQSDPLRILEISSRSSATGCIIFDIVRSRTHKVHLCQVPIQFWPSPIFYEKGHFYIVFFVPFGPWNNEIRMSRLLKEILFHKNCLFYEFFKNSFLNENVRFLVGISFHLLHIFPTFVPWNNEIRKSRLWVNKRRQLFAANFL